MKLDARSSQIDLFGDSKSPPAAPDGLLYQVDFIGQAEQRALASALELLTFTPFQFRGYEGKRRVRYFGWRYDEDAGQVAAVDAIPAFLLPLRTRIAAFANLPAEAFGQALVNQYDAGAGIGWHRDRPQFGEVAGVSLLSDCIMRFRRLREDGGWERFKQPLAACSAYRLAGPARSEWQHNIADHGAPRYSITFRTLR